MPDEAKLKAKYSKIWDDLRKWPEDRIKTNLKEKLEKEGWRITEISMGNEQGKDLEATKNGFLIHIEAKGEPKSLTSFDQERRQNVGGALMSLIQHMTNEKEKYIYCMAFPNNGRYSSIICKRIPMYVREKLEVYAILVGG